ncbi:MAG: hypothetical protein ACK4Z8_02760 [Novosphingobium sp.]
MAKFVMAKADGGHKYIQLQAEIGEEIPTEMVLAYANLQQSYSLTEIADRIRGCDNSLFKIAQALPG